MTSLISRIQYLAAARRKILLANLTVKSQVPAISVVNFTDGALQTVRPTAQCRMLIPAFRRPGLSETRQGF